MSYSIKKEKSIIKLFTALIFVGIALVVAGIVIYIAVFADAVNHFKPIADQFRSQAELEAAITQYVTPGVTGAVYLGMLGVAAIIVFAILSKKKRKALSRKIYELYKQQENQPQQ